MPLNINISFFPAFYVGPKSVHMISSALICKTQTYIETVCLMLKESNPSNLIWTFCAKLSLPSIQRPLRSLAPPDCSAPSPQLVEFLNDQRPVSDSRLPSLKNLRKYLFNTINQVPLTRAPEGGRGRFCPLLMFFADIKLTNPLIFTSSSVPDQK